MSLRILNTLTLLLVILGGINWGIVGAFDFNIVTTIFGPVEGESDPSLVARVVYVLIGLSALWQLGVLARRLVVRD